MPVLSRTDKQQTPIPSDRVARSRARACAAGALLLALAGMAAGAPAAAQTEPAYPAGACGEIVLAEFAWPTARLVSAVLDRLLTDGFGCVVTRSPASVDQVAGAIGAMADDDVVVVAPGVSAASLPVDARLRRGAPTISGGREGVFIPDWLQAANPDIETLSDAVRAADRFRARGEERPKFWTCPTSWDCYDESRRVADELGFADAFDIMTPSSGDALIEVLTEAHRDRRPWIGYFWTPSATTAANPVVRLAAGAARLCAPSGACAEPFSPDPAVTVYGAPLDRRAPEVAAFLQRFSASASASADALSWRARTNASIDQTADYLLARTPEVWRPLLPQIAVSAFEQALSARMTGIVD